MNKIINMSILNYTDNFIINNLIMLNDINLFLINDIEPEFILGHKLYHVDFNQNIYI